MLLTIAILMSLTAIAQVRVTSEGFLQVDYNSSNTQSISFGNNVSGYTPRGTWAIEHWDGGLNFWRPWPVSNSGSYFLFLKDDGNIGISDGTPSYRLDVNGDIATYGTLRIASDERFKRNVERIEPSLAKRILGLNVYRYNLNIKPIHGNQKEGNNETEKIEEKVEDSKKYYGVIAQELMDVFPELVDMDRDGFYNVDYIGLIPVLIETLKEQQNQIEELKSRVVSIEANCCTTSLKSASLTTGTDIELTENKAQLDQNIPNPFSKETRIGCFIPDQSVTSVLYIYNMNGTQLQQYSITGKGKQSVAINGNSFEPGMYLYALVIDGKEVDTKRMILTK